MLLLPIIIILVRHQHPRQQIITVTNIIVITVTNIIVVTVTNIITVTNTDSKVDNKPDTDCASSDRRGENRWEFLLLRIINPSM